MEEDALGDPGPQRDLGGRGPGEAAGREDLAGGRQEPLPLLVGIPAIGALGRGAKRDRRH